MTIKPIRILILTVMVILILSPFLSAQPQNTEDRQVTVLLNESGIIPPVSGEDIVRYSFEVAPGTTILVLDARAEFFTGTGQFRLLNPDGTNILTPPGETTPGTERIRQLRNVILDVTDSPGTYILELEARGASGEWRARVYILPDPNILGSIQISGILMLVIALAFLLFWWKYSGTGFRWFAAGATIWIVAIILKTLLALLFTNGVLSFFQNTLDPSAYYLAGSTYIGLLSAATEIGITIAAALYWKTLYQDANRAIAVGIGAGTFEALLLALNPLLIPLLFPTFPAEIARMVLAGAAPLFITTSVPLLVAPAERIIAILVHTGTRTLVFLGIAIKRWQLVLAGFLLFAGLDAIAGYYHISGRIGWESFWIIEAALVPFAVVSVLAVIWCIRHWPDSEVGNQISEAGDQPPHTTEQE